MPHTHKPRDGSLQYWPRKKSKRIYPNISNYPNVKEAKPLAFAGYKVGMTRVFFKDNKKGSPTYGQTISHPVTVIETPSIFVLGLRAYSNDSGVISELYAKDIPKEIKKKINIKKNKTKELEDFDDLRLIVCTQPNKTGIGKKKPEIFEIGVGGEKEDKKKFAMEKIGKELKISEVFSEGEYIDSLSVTKGKGFQGVVKRYGVKLRGRKDEKHHRQIGVIGTEGVARVIYTVPQPGQVGFHRRTEFNKKIYKIGEDPKEINPNGGFLNYGLVKDNYILIKGSVSGPKKRLILLRAPVRANKKGYPIEIEKMDKTSQQ